MSSGCGDVLSLEDLKVAKLHQLFEAEVITGKSGGTASGADIEYATNMVTGQVQKTLPAILRDSGFQPASFDFTAGGTLTASDRNKAVYYPANGNYYSWSGSLPKTVAPGTDPTTDPLWVPQTDHLLRSDLAASSGAGMIGTTSGETQQVLNNKTAEMYAAVRKKSPATLYVSSSGSDSNSGSLASPLLTIQAAINKIMGQQQDYDVTISVGAGTFAPSVASGALPFGVKILIQGAGDTTIISGVSTAFTAQNGAQLTLKNMKIDAITSGFGTYAHLGGIINLDNVTFGAVAGTGHVVTDNGGRTNIVSGYKMVQQPGNFHYWNRGGGSELNMNGINVAIPNNISVDYFIYNEMGATVLCQGWTYSGAGAVTGGRYVTTKNATINAGTSTQAQRDAFFPGTHNNAGQPVDQPNVGGKFDAYPDYGFTTLQTVSATGLTAAAFLNIPDSFTQIVLRWDGVQLANNGGYMSLQFLPVDMPDWVVDASYYKGLDHSNTTPNLISEASAIRYQPKIAGGGASYGSLVINCFQGGGYPTISGNYTDNANIFHTVQSVFLDANWIRNLRFQIFGGGGTFTAGTFQLIGVY